jgi:lactoylglutathione lyase
MRTVCQERPAAAILLGTKEGQIVRVPEVGRGGDLGQEALPAQRLRQLRPEYLDRDLAPVLPVIGQVHRCHPTLAQFALDPVSTGECGGEPCGAGIEGHGLVLSCPPPRGVHSGLPRGGPMKLRYVIIFVNDVGRSLAFYSDLLGMKVREQTRTSAELDADGCTLALHRAHVDSEIHHHAPMLAGSCRIGFFITDLDSVHRRLLEAGVPCLSPPETKFDLRVALYEDPDGINLTLAEPIAV